MRAGNLKYSIITILLSGFNLSLLFSQSIDQEYLDDFSGFVTNNNVLLRWTMSAGTTCDGIRIMRTTDTTSFAEVGRIEGVCGSPEISISFEFLDENADRNRTNYYRLELGNLGVSNILSVFVSDFGKDEYLVFPQPMKNAGRIYFDNPLNRQYSMEVVNLTGTSIFQSFSQNNFFDLETTSWPVGAYFFTIQNNENTSKIMGKLIIIR